MVIYKTTTRFFLSCIYKEAKALFPFAYLQREIRIIKDNCPSDEDALTSDSGDSVIVTYVTSYNANFPLEIRKGK